MEKLIAALACCWAWCGGLLGQSVVAPCNSLLDSAAVVSLVQQRGLLLLPQGYTLDELQQYPSMAGQTNFDEKTCRWTVVSRKTEHSNKGNCKHTNGCTVVITQTVVVCADKQQIVRKKKHKEIFPNYE